MKKMLKRKEELLILLDAVKCADSEYDYKLQTINDIEYQLYLLEADIYHYKMMRPLKYMLYGFTIISIILITYAIFK
jgi:sulfur transfer complex TusBCD TusB component (DsrH family)